MSECRKVPAVSVIKRIERGELSVCRTYGWAEEEQYELLRLAKIGAEAEKPRPIDDWHEDLGDVLWWVFPIFGPPYCGTPLDSDWIPEYYTHWTPLIVPEPGEGE